jgi:hypothetical protein
MNGGRNSCCAGQFGLASSDKPANSAIWDENFPRHQTPVKGGAKPGQCGGVKVGQ